MIPTPPVPYAETSTVQAVPMATYVTLTVDVGWEPIAAVQMLETAPARNYHLSIAAEPYDMRAKCKQGVNDALASNLLDFDLSCCTTSGLPATLIAPDSLVSAGHYHPLKGSTVTLGGVTRTVIDVFIDPLWGIGNKDFSFCRVDGLFPVRPALLAPINWPSYFMFESPTQWYTAHIPVVYTDKDGGRYIQELFSVSEFGASLNHPSTKSAGYEFAHVLSSGDSGSGCFLVVDGRLVLIGVYNSSKNISIPGDDLGIQTLERSFIGAGE